MLGLRALAVAIVADHPRSPECRNILEPEAARRETPDATMLGALSDPTKRVKCPPVDAENTKEQGGTPEEPGAALHGRHAARRGAPGAHNSLTPPGRLRYPPG